MADFASLMMLAAGAAEAHHEVEPSLLGLSPSFIVAAAMGALVLIALYVKVPAMLTSGLDSGISEIRKQLNEAKALRAEAEALRQEYANKIANAEKDAAAMLDHARHEADAIVAKAETDATTMVARREKMASDKIEAAERGAIADLRNRAANAAIDAARGLIAAKHTANADKALVDEAIAGI